MRSRNRAKKGNGLRCDYNESVTQRWVYVFCAVTSLASFACEQPADTEDEETAVDDDDGATKSRKKKKKKRNKKKGGVSGPAATVKQLSHGRRHSCALLSSGLVQCWGRNHNQQLGMPMPELSLTPMVVSGIADAQHIAAAGNYTCVIDSKREVLCWGDVPERGKTAPAVVPGFEGAISLDAGPYHFCAATQSGQARCVGSNRKGELGIGSMAGAASVPGPAVGLAQVVEVSVGYQHACARDASGKVKCWGANRGGQLGDGTKADNGTPVAVPLAEPATRIAAGHHNSCAVLASGAVHCWGEPGWKFLAGKDEGTQPIPMALGAKATAVEIGDSFACALLDDGGVSCWGRAIAGRLGRESGSFGLPPDRVPRILNATAISAFDGIACAVTDGGKETSCWGSAESGRLGDGSASQFPSPVVVPTLADAADIVAGNGYTCALRKAGSVACWGDGTVDTGEMKAGFLPRANVPTDIVGVSDVKTIFGLHTYAVVRKADDSVQLFHGGVLRNPTSFQKGRFTPKDAPQLAGIIDASVVYSDLSYAALDNGKLLGFKLDYTGKVETVAIGGVSGATRVSASMKEVCFVRATGTVGCFEQTLKGYGPWPTSHTAKVADIPGLSDAASLAIDYGHGCVLHKGGDVSCYRNFGSGPKNLVKVAGVSGAVQVVTTSDISNVSCALLTSGAVHCWSSYGHHEGQLGTGTFEKRQTPAPVTGIHDAVELAASENHVCALHKSGKVSCWGDNEHDQVGAAPPPVAWAPVRVRIASPARVREEPAR